MNIIYVSGQNDYSALNMEESEELKEITEILISDNNLNEVTSSDGSIVRLLKFNDIDERFISFIRNNIMDYDYSKCSSFYTVDEIMRGYN